VADLNLSASPSSGGENPKASTPKGPAAGTPKLRVSPTGDHSPVSRTAGAIIGVVSVVALPDLVYVAKDLIGMSYNTSEALILLVIAYLVILLPVSIAARLIEKKVRRGGFGN